jgi:DNA polymerase-3 subunit delta'
LLDAFAQVVRRGRFAHAYLFVGPEGVGKKLFAKQLAKTLLCENRNGDFAACGHCSSCLLMDAGTHPDFFVTGRPEEKNELPVDVMRELCRSLSLKSARGRGKVAVLDDADDLNDESANCFLKTLEEPPPGSVLLLIGSSRDRQMPTILSRCQVVRFAPLPDALVREVLAEHDVTDGTLVERLLPLANGAPGQALALADEELWKFRTGFLNELGQRPFDPAALARRFTEFAEEAGKEAAVQRRQAERVLRLLFAFLDDALLLAAGAEPHARSPEELRRIQAFAAGRSAERIMELMERCLEAHLQIRRYVQLSLVIEGLLDAFCD